MTRTALVLGFVSRGVPGRVEVNLGAVKDPEGLGLGLLSAGIDLRQSLGFPAVKAAVHFDGEGYRGRFGWVQVTERSVEGEDVPVVEVDLPPLLAGGWGPMCAYGFLPTMFDAPVNPHHPDGLWTAHTFLTEVPDVVRSRALRALTGFQWGYRLRAGRPLALPLQSLSPSAWEAASAVLDHDFPDWAFLDSNW